MEFSRKNTLRVQKTVLIGRKNIFRVYKTISEEKFVCIHSYRKKVIVGLCCNMSYSLFRRGRGLLFLAGGFKGCGRYCRLFSEKHVSFFYKTISRLKMF